MVDQGRLGQTLLVAIGAGKFGLVVWRDLSAVRKMHTDHMSVQFKLGSIALSANVALKVRHFVNLQRFPSLVFLNVLQQVLETLKRLITTGTGQTGRTMQHLAMSQTMQIQQCFFAIARIALITYEGGITIASRKLSSYTLYPLTTGLGGIVLFLPDLLDFLHHRQQLFPLQPILLMHQTSFFKLGQCCGIVQDFTVGSRTLHIQARPFFHWFVNTLRLTLSYSLLGCRGWPFLFCPVSGKPFTDYIVRISVVGLPYGVLQLLVFLCCKKHISQFGWKNIRIQREANF